MATLSYQAKKLKRDIYREYRVLEGTLHDVTKTCQCPYDNKIPGYFDLLFREQYLTIIHDPWSTHSVHSFVLHKTIRQVVIIKPLDHCGDA